MFREGSNKPLIIVLALIVLLLLWRGSSITVSTGAEKNVISVSSTANAKAQPDKAEVYLRIETLDADAQKSQQENSRISDNVISRLMAAGAAKKDIETSQYSLQQKIRYGREGEQIIEGYSAVHILKVTTTEMDNVGSLIDAGVNGGANGIENIVFTLSDEKQAELRNEAIAKAAVEAKGKAKKIADSLGAKLGRLSTASESSYNFVPYLASFAVAEKAAPTPTQILPQAVEVSVTLNIVYSIG